MDDLLSELDDIDGIVGGSARTIEDGSSSPLRPNTKYCTMAQPAAMKPAPPWKPPPRWKGAGVNATPVVYGLDPLPWEKLPSKARDTSSRATSSKSASSMMTSSSNLPETVRKIMAVTEAGGMEVDEDPPSISDKSSSPLKPNEKYCSIVSAHKPRVARVAPIVQPPRHSQRIWNQGVPSYAGRYRNPGGSPPHYGGSSGSREHMSYYDTPHRGPRRHSYGEEKALTEWERQEKRRVEDRELQRRMGEEAAKIERIKLATEWQRQERKKQREIEEERKRQREIEEDRKRNRQRRIEEEAARVARAKKEAEEKRRYAEDIRKIAEERRRADKWAREREDEERRERKARDMLKSYKNVKPKQEEETVQMKKQEFEEFKARYLAEGERVAEAKRAEAAARMKQCAHADRDKEVEPEPMEIEESDVVESSVPASCSGIRIAPMQLIVKEEPPDEVESPQDTPVVRLEEIPLPPGPAPKGNRNEEVANKYDDQEEIQIIDKPPAEVVTLSDDEDTVVEATVGGGHLSIKQEPPATREQEEDFWVVGCLRGRKKAHVFDLSKVKKEKKEVSGAKVSDSSANTQSLPFNAAKVKAEPGEKEKEEGKKEMGTKISEGSKDTASESTQGVPFKARVKEEPVEKETEQSEGRKEKEKDTVLSSSAIKSEPTERLAGSITVSPTTTVSPSSIVSPPRVACGPVLPLHVEPSQLLQQMQQTDGEGQVLQPSAVPQEADVAAALAAARRLLREIGHPSQQVLPPLQPLPARPLRQAHEPSLGSFLHSLRSTSRKRRRWCEFDEDEEEWLRWEDSSDRHEWGAKRKRIEEDEEESG